MHTILRKSGLAAALALALYSLVKPAQASWEFSGSQSTKYDFFGAQGNLEDAKISVICVRDKTKSKVENTFAIQFQPTMTSRSLARLLQSSRCIDSGESGEFCRVNVSYRFDEGRRFEDFWVFTVKKHHFDVSRGNCRDCYDAMSFGKAMLSNRKLSITLSAGNQRRFLSFSLDEARKTLQKAISPCEKR